MRGVLVTGADKMLLYSQEDARLVETSRWCLTNGYPSRRRNGRIEYLHILILGTAADMEVDHKNRDKLDVRRRNLRHVIHHSNTQNLSLSKSNQSGFRGVSFDKSRGKWKAYATIHGKQKMLGRFSTAAEAHVVVKQYRSRHMKGAVD